MSQLANIKIIKGKKYVFENVYFKDYEAQRAAKSLRNRCENCDNESNGGVIT